MLDTARTPVLRYIALLYNWRWEWCKGFYVITYRMYRIDIDRYTVASLAEQYVRLSILTRRALCFLGMTQLSRTKYVCGLRTNLLANSNPLQLRKHVWNTDCLWQRTMASPGLWARRGTARMFTKSSRNCRHFYINITRGQSNLTKSASRGANSPVRGHPRGSKVVPLNSWGRVSY